MQPLQSVVHGEDDESFEDQVARVEEKIKEHVEYFEHADNFDEMQVVRPALLPGFGQSQVVNLKVPDSTRSVRFYPWGLTKLTKRLLRVASGEAAWSLRGTSELINSGSSSKSKKKSSLAGAGRALEEAEVSSSSSSSSEEEGAAIGEAATSADVVSLGTDEASEPATDRALSGGLGAAQGPEKTEKAEESSAVSIEQADELELSDSESSETKSRQLEDSEGASEDAPSSSPVSSKKLLVASERRLLRTCEFERDAVLERAFVTGYTRSHYALLSTSLSRDAGVRRQDYLFLLPLQVRNFWYAVGMRIRFCSWHRISEIFLEEI